jgi:hypothetical protein
MRLTRLIPTFAVVAASVVAGCGKSDKTDAALQSDLSLASQQQQAHLDSINALEANAGTAPAPAVREPETRVRRRSSRGSSTSGTTTSTSTGDVVVKHTQRDAAIGAVAGGLLGATTSRNKVQGGVIGAVVGGVLGGVVGNNVDKTKKPPTE